MLASQLERFLLFGLPEACIYFPVGRVNLGKPNLTLALRMVALNP